MTAAGTAIVDEVAHAKDRRKARQDRVLGPEELVEQSCYFSLHCSLVDEEEIHS